MRLRLLFLVLASALPALGEEPSRAIRVRVVTFGGAPVAGARLEVRRTVTDPYDPMWPGAGAPTTEAWWRGTPAGADDTLVAAAATDDQGWARIDGLLDGAFDVTAHAPGLAVRGAQVLSPPVRGAPAPTILLDAGHTLRGRVVSEAGAAIAGALVFAEFSSAGMARWSDSERPLVARADDRGEFRIDGVPAGSAVLHACPPGTWFARDHLVDAPRDVPVEIVLSLHGVEAVVRDLRTGVPVPGASVSFSTYGFHMSNMLVHAVTGESGRFSLAVPERWLGAGQIVAPGYLLGLRLGESMENPPDLERLAGRTLEIRAVPGARVRGVVRDPSGPVASAIVTATWLAGFETPCVWERSGPDGTFELWAWPGLLHVAARPPGAPAEEDQELDVLLATGKAGERGLVDVPGEGRDGIVLSLPARPRGGRITGRVVTTAGVPVRAWPGIAGDKRRRGAATGMDGAFDLEGVPAGEARVAVHVQGIGEVKSEPLRIEDGGTTHVDLVVPGEPLGRVEGRVVGRAGPAYVVGTFGRRFPVASDGSFAFDTEVLAGEVSIDVVGPDGLEGSAKAKCAKGGRVNVGEIRLEEPRFADFRVVAEGGAPVPGATASIYIPPDAIYCGAFELPTDLGVPADREGRIRIRLPRAEHFDLRIRAPGLSGLDLSHGFARDVVVLKPLGAMAGRVRLADGTPAAGCRIEASTRFKDDVPSYEREAVADANGRFRIDGLVSAGHDVFIESGASGPSIARLRTEVVAPDEALDLVVERASVIEGRVVDARERPVADIEVTASPCQDGLPELETRTGADGGFRLAGAVAGKYDLRVSRDGLWPDGKRRGVAAGTRDLVLRAEIGYRITGRLVDGDGSPRAGWVVEAERNDRGGCRDHRARTDRLGRFVLEEMEGGLWNLKVGRWGHLDPESGGRVRAGSEEVVLVLR